MNEGLQRMSANLTEIAMRIKTKAGRRATILLLSVILAGCGGVGQSTSGVGGQPENRRAGNGNPPATLPEAHRGEVSPYKDCRQYVPNGSSMPDVLPCNSLLLTYELHAWNDFGIQVSIAAGQMIYVTEHDSSFAYFYATNENGNYWASLDQLPPGITQGLTQMMPVGERG